jgi:predicted DNA repair protein MutK
MAAGSLLALLDDIATILDDVSVMTKVAAKKTAGVLGDDLALNAQQVSGVDASRELPVVWAVAKGSFLNKIILVPAALAISYFIPWLITPLLMIGGAFLCFEGAEKLAHKFLHSKTEDATHKAELAEAVADPNVDLVALEKDKIKGAIRTDFILSAEIIVIALGTVATATFSKQATVVTAIAIIMTVGVYGLVAGIVKLDDIGLHLMLKKGAGVYRQLQRKIGAGLLAFAPKLMRFLSIAGTAAMFMVGGSIIGHGVPALHHFSEHVVKLLQNLPAVGGILATISPIVVDAIIGLIVGVICVGLFEIINKLRKK